MKDLIDKVLIYLPQYLLNLGVLLMRPEKFINERNGDTDEDFANGLLFLAISLVMYSTMSLKRPPSMDIWNYLVAQAIVNVLQVFVMAIGARFAWRVVGGQATVRRFFISYAYCSGAALIILSPFELLAQDFLKAGAPELYAEALEAQREYKDFRSDNPAYATYSRIMLAGYIAVSIWATWSWPTFRHLNGLSGNRSLMAYLIFGFAAIPLLTLVSLIEVALLRR
jgi:hypothetical protein